ncbi:MAG: AAA family ATPase [bacterium]
MSYTIALAGKGGTGKTTLASLIIRYLRGKGKTPVLAIDADANANLHEALGVEIGETIGHLREKALESIKDLPVGVTKDQYIEYKIHETLVEGEGFDLMTMGRPEGPGCYCYANHLIRKYSETIGTGYPYVVMDNEAGLEHLSRRTTNEVDQLLITSDPSQRGLRTVKRIMDICDELKLQIKRMGLVLNRVPLDEAAARGQSSNPLKDTITDLKIEWLGNIPDDAQIEAFDFQGKPLIELPPDSGAFKAVEKIMGRIGI